MVIAGRWECPLDLDFVRHRNRRPCCVGRQRLCHKSLTEFIMDSAYLATQNALLDQRLFMLSGNRYEALLDLLNRPAEENLGVLSL